MHYRSLVAMSATAVLAASTAIATAGTSTAVTPQAAEVAAQPAPAGSFAYSGQAARDFQMPADMRELHTTTFPDGRTQTRYQQMVGRASVFGGQITVVEKDGEAQSVIGAYFPGLTSKNERRISKAAARAAVARDIGDRGQWSTVLRIDPRNARLFHEVESIRSAHRPIRWVDAGNGKVVKAFDAVAHGEGVGVKGDTKTFDTTFDAGSALWQLRTPDSRQETYDLRNKTSGGVLMTDADDIWDLDRGIRSPSQPAGVDAHYYAGVVDDFYSDTFGRNSIDDNGMQIISRVHYSNNYCNAFWNGAVMTYGDGDGRTCLPLSGGLDVDSHELTHGVTDYTSNLIYENESGALNEAFSDMMGNTAEFYADAHGLETVVGPDWFIGEDILPDGTANPGFRNMADPAEDGDPSHYSQRYTGTDDNGGVHTNSGIANHAYFLTVEGGSNASCFANASHGVLLTEDCDVVVPALGLDRTAQVFYEAFTGLTEYANMCDARNATIATAAATGDGAALGLAWDAVGVHDGCTEGTPPPPPCEGSANATLPIESPHPYGNNGDCTWTYTNPGGPGFKFVFTLMDMEKDYDYVYVKDGDGNELAAYTGTVRRDFTSPCITTPTGSIQMVTDPAVTAQGFTVSAVEPC